ncbi:MAG: adenylate/guanylate cyclase domain-containing protein [Armatimonadota bacterium]|nr:adenylate/guanylate cyclase domain-containing protein [Armatimonadota bacterium]
MAEDVQGTLTILFTDVEGSTDLRTQQGDDRAQEILRAHERLLREQLQVHGGREVVFLGDGFMVAFGSARRAVACAIGIQRAFDAYNREHPDRQIRVRTGLNSGEVVQESGTLYGAAVNAAARIAARARGGQILVSQVVKDLAGSVKEFVFSDRGLSALKGFPTPWRLFEVSWQERAVTPRAEAGETKPAVPTPVASTTIPSREGPGAETDLRPAGAPLVGRETERAIIAAEIDAASARALRVVSVEGEAGIGKTRMLEVAAQEALARGFGVVTVGADEELRGPFVLLRTLLVSTTMERLADQAGARESLEHARDVLWGRQQIGGGLSPSEQMLRVYDMATVALRALAAARCLAILFDDIQWADEDSLKLIRYLVRTSSLDPLFIMLASRPESGVGVTPATALLADLERMRLVRRLRLERLGRLQTQQLLQQLLDGPVSAEAATTLHERGEGVPFFIVEFTRAFREARLLQQVEGTWKVSAAARSPVPASVQILIERRLAQLPGETRTVLADAAILGRRFRVADLARIESAVGGQPAGPAAVEDLLGAALRLNLVTQFTEGAAYDYSFTHDEVRGALMTGQPRHRRRSIHAAIVAMLAASAEGSVANLPALAHHSLEAGNHEQGIRYSIDAARAALQAHAPEEAIRAIDAARPSAASPRDRAELLCLRDDALAVLGRGRDRMATLAELAALAKALGDEALELQVTARRASAARLAGEYEQAADLAVQALTTAADRGDDRMALTAELELGQALMRTSLGESFMPAPTEVDLDGAAEAFERAAVLATRLVDLPSLAAARRELGVVENGRARRIFLAMVEHSPEVLNALPLVDPSDDPRILEHFAKAKRLIGEAIELYDQLGDRRSLMSSLIALAYANIIEETQYGHAGRIEQIRRLRRGLQRLTSESERAESELHMLYSIHVYARGHGYPHLSLQRGAETFEAARAVGDHPLAFLAAGGVALTHIEMAAVPEADAWLDRAAATALEATKPLPARLMEMWRGLLRSAAGDTDGMQRHLDRALALATERGSPAGRCELLALLAIGCAYHGVARSDADLLAQAEAHARDALQLAAVLPGDLPWEARARAALGEVALARGDAPGAAQAAIAALDGLKRTRTGSFYPFVLPDVLLAVARCLDGVNDPRAHLFRTETRLILDRVAEATRDDTVRARWFQAPVQAGLTRLVGAAATPGKEHTTGEMRAGLTERQAEILRHVTSGQTNGEIAKQLEMSEQAVVVELDRIFAALGVSTKGQATAVAVMEGVA